jgi:hypothetical protein
MKFIRDYVMLHIKIFITSLIFMKKFLILFLRLFRMLHMYTLTSYVQNEFFFQ